MNKGCESNAKAGQCLHIQKDTYGRDFVETKWHHNAFHTARPAPLSAPKSRIAVR